MKPKGGREKSKVRAAMETVFKKERGREVKEKGGKGLKKRQTIKYQEQTTNWGRK